MPYQNVMPQFKAGTLHSGAKRGPKVTNPKQALAIMLSEKRKSVGHADYRSNLARLAREG